MKKLLLLVVLVVLVNACSVSNQVAKTSSSGLNVIVTNDSPRICKTYQEAVHSRDDKVQACVWQYCLRQECQGQEIKVYNFTNSTQPVKDYVDKLALDICGEDNNVTYIGEIKTISNWSRATVVQVTCPNYEKNRELKKQKEKEEALLASINSKRDICTKMGFENETEVMANCILQLMLEENRSSSSSSSSSSLSSAMKEQTRIMEKQLRLQKLEQTRENMRRFNYMMQYGKIPMW